MTLGACVILCYLDLSVDARLPVAWMYAYLIGRPLFAIGYLADAEAGRIIGLFPGGFWQNMSVYLYATAVNFKYSE